MHISMFLTPQLTKQVATGPGLGLERGGWTDRGMEFLGADGARPAGAAASHRARSRSGGKVEGRRGGGADVGAPRRGSGAQVGGSGAQVGAERSMFFFEQERKGLR